MHLGVVLRSVITVALLHALATYAEPLPWPPQDLRTITDCTEDGQPKTLPGNDDALPVSVAVVASVEARSYKRRDSRIIARIECPNSKRGKDLRIETNSWGVSRAQLKVIQVLRGSPLADPFYAFADVSEWGPPISLQERWSLPDADPEKVREVERERTKLFLYCLRWNDGVFWIVNVHALERDVNGSFVLREEALQRAKLAARGHSVSVLEYGLQVVVFGALLEELDLSLLCDQPNRTTHRSQQRRAASEGR